MGKKQRAMDEQAKQARRNEIIEAALSLLEEAQDYDSVTMSRIAKEAGVAKGTLYLYFQTKEELFMQAMGDILGDWLGAWIADLEALPTPAPIEDVVELLAKTFTERPLLTSLYTILHSTIEANISTEVAIAYKRRLRDEILPIGELIEKKVAQLNEPSDGFRFLLRTNAIMLGVYQQANPAPAAAKALKAIDLAMFRVDFEEEFTAICTALLRGWQS